MGSGWLERRAGWWAEPQGMRAALPATPQNDNREPARSAGPRQYTQAAKRRGDGPWATEDVPVASFIAPLWLAYLG